MIIIDDKGPQLSTSQVAELEARIGFSLPDHYRRFLLENNGGTPTPDTVDVNGIQGSPTDLRAFFGINQDIEAHNIEWMADIMSDRIERRLIPIAYDSGGNVFCLSLSGVDRDSVYYYDENYWHVTNRLHLVATSFASFLEKIRQFEN